MTNTLEHAFRAGHAAAEEVLGAHGSEWLLDAIERAWSAYQADNTPEERETDTLERREEIEAALYDCFSQGDCAWTVRQAVTKYVLDLALSLPAREVGEIDAETAAEIAHVEKMCIVAYLRAQSDIGADHGLASEKGTTRRAAFGGGSLALSRAADNIEADEHHALATTPAPREKLEADLVEAKKALEPFAAKVTDIGDDESDIDLYRPSMRYNEAPNITVGDIRRAAATLNRLSGEG